LFHGDLGTGDWITSLQLHWSIEDTLWNWFQFVVFVPSLSHVKMACADALWRTFIQPNDARVDDTCLIHDVSKLHPKETGIIGSKPGFHHMHLVIRHVGICRHLDCWRLEVAHWNPEHATLKQFAASKPAFKDLEEIASWLATHYVADNRLTHLHNQPTAQWDQQHENALLLNKYCLLYEVQWIMVALQELRLAWWHGSSFSEQLGSTNMQHTWWNSLPMFILYIWVVLSRFVMHDLLMSWHML
jgi:hypothetical protein